jgi:hypothetical protein
MFSATMIAPIQNTIKLNSTNSTTNFYNCSGASDVVSPFGCCSNNETVCVDSECSNCDMVPYTSTTTFSKNDIDRIEKDFMYDMIEIFKRFTNILMLGGCSGTRYGCCHDTNIMCQNPECSNCVLSNRGTIGGCAGTEYGCCADGIKNCRDPHCMNCPITQQYDYIGGCAGTQYGCCPNTLINCIDQNCTNCRIYQTE